MAFEVKGEQAQWREVYDHLRKMDVGDVVTDEELAEMLPDAAEHSWRSAFFRARREMQDEHSRSFDRERGIGYRMVEAREHLDLAKRQHKRARRRLDAAQREAHSADRSRLTREERRRIDDIELHLASQAQMLKRLESRQGKAEERLALSEKDQMALSDRMDRLADLLKRHGITEDDGDESDGSARAE